MGTSSSTAVSQRLEHASKTGVLSLRELKLEEVPALILDVKSKLRTLDISFNKISVFPDCLEQFSNLRTLSFNNNKLVQLLPSFGELKKLETVHLQYNMLTSLPHTLSSLTALKTLDLSHNQLSSFSPSFYSFPHLDYLNMSHNRLQSLPEEGIEKLHTLELNLSANSLPRLPIGLSMCKRLKVLRVEENCLELSGLPREILENSNVSLLCLDGNLFQQRDVQTVPGYQQYMERFTATRRKVD